MSAKLKLCSGHACNGELRVIWKRVGKLGYCWSCWSCQQTKIALVRKPIARLSPKRTKEKVTYLVKRKLFLIANPMCQANLPGCAGPSNQVHHKKGRTGENYLDMTTWLAVDDHCHKIIELNPILAKEMGFSKNRLEKKE